MVFFIFLGLHYLQPTLPAYAQRAVPQVRWPLLTARYHVIALLFLVALLWNLRGILHDRPVARMVFASVLVNIGMWLERYIIIVPSLSHPRLPLGSAVYHATWVEWSLTAGCFALLALFCLVFSRYFPMLPLWEMTAEDQGVRRGAETEQVSAESAVETLA